MGDAQVQSGAERPKVLISRCITFEHCRWNGDIIASPYVEKLKQHVDFITVCPEVEIGCGVPRKPLRLVMHDSGVKMLQHETGTDVTAAMKKFSDGFMAAIGPFDGMILKERSPSCGISNVKMYVSGNDNAAVLKKGSGLFGGALKENFPLRPLASEGHLFNFSLREHFYTQIFTLARFREMRRGNEMKKLVEFHTRHKYILLAYNESCMRRMGLLVAHHSGKNGSEVFDEYYLLLEKALSRPPRIQAPVNVLMHALGYFSEKITGEEKKFFLGELDLYREKKIPLSVCNALVESWIVRFDERYLASQYFFKPYPRALVELSDSGK